MSNSRMVRAVLYAFVVMIAGTGCSLFSNQATVRITQPQPPYEESSPTKEIIPSTSLENLIPTEDTITLRSPLNPITQEDYRNVNVQLRYRVSDVNYPDSGHEILLSSMDADCFIYTGFAQFSDEKTAIAEMHAWYDRNLRGEEGGGFVGEIALANRDGYDILVIKSTDDNMPSYAVYIRVDTAIIHAFCFSYHESDIQIIHYFFACFGYAVED